VPPSTTPIVDPDDLALVTRGLTEVVHGDRGTARRLAAIPAAGKTGTAQVVRLQEGVRQEDLARELRHHALFVGWAPLDHPALVTAVIVEHGGDGGSAAAPVAGRVLEAYLLQDAIGPELEPSIVVEIPVAETP
jgi:penicillin-binding protein 2